ncbi:MAG: tetratricopeptide repeat protein [Opitutae bacterium]|nr:tetratricopeptide repeat protein [Opitutae bacterium]
MPPAAATLENALRLHRAGQLAAAAAQYQAVLKAQPANFDAWNLLGLVAQQSGDHTQALACFARAIALNARIATLHLQRGQSLRELGRTDEAVAAFSAAIALQPDLAEAHHQLGNARKNLRRYAEALISLRRAAQLAPDQPTIRLNLGVACLESDMLDEAVAQFREAIRLQPDQPDAHNILGHALLTQGNLSAARPCFIEALRLRPNYAAAHNNLGRLHRAQGRIADAIASYRAALAAQPHAPTHSNLLLALNYSPDVTPEEIFAEHRHWAALYAAPLRPTTPPPAHDFAPDRRLRIGLVSPDFDSHAVAFFIAPFLTDRRREFAEVICYSDVRTPDATTQRLRATADQWRDIAGRDDAQVAAQIREDRIDILFDLAGHTARNRLLVFARRPAPVQITWIGYPNTTGLDTMDYRLTDAVSDPVGQTDGWHSEKLVRLPETFSCYRPPADSPPVSALPALTSGRITFGCFNNFAKITPAAIARWTQILGALPDSRLMLKSRGLTDPETAAALHAAFARGGIAAERIVLHSDELSVSRHLSLYHDIDIALDAYPYNGTTTTCEALWMGVPVVTLAGRTHVARVGASLLTHLGAPEWIAATPEEYVAKALALARDLPRLSAIRQGLRERMQTSPLCDAPRFVGHLETALRALWVQRCQTAKPDRAQAFNSTTT